LRSGVDLLDWSLPYGFPASVLYDYLLKVHQCATIDINALPVKKSAIEFIEEILRVDQIIERQTPDRVFISHAVGRFACIFWAATRRGIPVVCLYGDSGLQRFSKFSVGDGIFHTVYRPSVEVFQEFEDEKQKQIRQVGREYLAKRMFGKIDNLGAEFAFQKVNSSIDRNESLTSLGFDPHRRTVSIYTSNWFDYPHTYGMKNFRDFREWVMATMGAINQNKSVQWLLRPHPLDQKYGGPSLESVIRQNSKIEDHVKFVPLDWSGLTVMNCSDGLVTYHGTIGIEATSRGIPVMNADEGWYHDWAFTHTCRSREEYLGQLATCDWIDALSSDCRERAFAFSGMFWGRPEWQRDLLFADDSRQEKIYSSFSSQLLEMNIHEWKLEVSDLRMWLNSDDPYFHDFKLRRSSTFR
jgi:hypothetical protein